MEKAPVIIEDSPEEKTPRGSRLKRRPTACKDKRRAYGHCGLCGSGNIVYEGVMCCTRCGAENAYVSSHSGHGLWFDPKRNEITSPCTCSKQPCGISGSTLVHEEVQVCLDCGAVRSQSCPVCNVDEGQFRRGSSCWTGTFGDKYCPSCGLRKNGYGHGQL